MKKVGAFLLTAAMVLSLVGCGSKQDPKEIYDAGMKKSQELTSMDVDYEMDMVMTQGDETMDILLHGGHGPEDKICYGPG